MTDPPSPPPVPEFLQEEDLTDECIDLLSCLPRERGWCTEYMYQYQGFWIAPRYLQGLLAFQKHFQAQDSDIILVTTPKSGTTWLKAMAFALLNRSRFLDLHHHPLLTTNPHDLVPFLDLRLYGGRDRPDLSTFASPRLFAAHASVGSLPRSVKDSSCKIVYLCRDPKDVFVSFWHFTNKLRPEELGTIELEELFDSFCNGVSPFGPFWDHVSEYWNESLKNSHKILFLKYEEIHGQPAAQLKRLAEFLMCPFSLEEEAKGTVDEILRLCSFENLSNLEVNKTGKLLSGTKSHIYFHRGEVGGSSKVLSPDMVKRVNHISEKKMQNSEFKF